MKRGLFPRREHKVPGLNTASLPDLIFTVLFFFMIVTHMREVSLHVGYSVPQGTQLQKLGHKQSVCHIYIGRPLAGDEAAARKAIHTADGETFCLQIEGEVATMDDVKEFVARERSSMATDDQARMTVALKADRDVPMGIISDVKRELGQAFALRISYSAVKK